MNKVASWGGKTARFFDSLFRPLDIASLVVFRILFGGIMVWEVCRYFQYDWIRQYYIDPTFFFTYFGFSWVRPWPGQWMYVHFVALGVLAFFIAIGLFYRISAALFFLGFTYVFLLDQANYLNHFYFVSLLSFLMILVPAHRRFSIDVWRRPALRGNYVPAWALWVLRAQIGIVYFFAGVAKINPDFLRGEPMRMWLAQRQGLEILGWHAGQFFVQEWAVWFFTYGGLLFDLLIFPALLWPRTRVIALAAVTFFHVMNAYLFSIGIFPWISLGATYVLFLPPDWPMRFPRFNKGATRFEVTSQPKFSPGAPRALTFFFGFYFLVQVLVPLRHLLYPGTVHWSEEGHRFSWHMKLRDKEATGSLRVRDPQTEESWIINPDDLLTRRQVIKMMKTPDMILQFAHHMARQIKEQVGRDVEIRADIEVSLNGRKPQLMIDPTVNLAARERTLRHADWILPLTTPLHTTDEANGSRGDAE